MKKVKKIIIIFIILAAVAGLVSSKIIDKINSQKILTVGADLSIEQRNIVLSYLNIDEKNTKEIVVTNEDVHNYLDNILSPEVIGESAYSCAYIEPTTEGGIHIRTVNITTVTSDMIRNALVTSGIANANIICVAPVEVSGAGSLAGIFKAYEEINRVELDEDKMKIASDELSQTINISKVIGNDSAVKMISTLKEEIIASNLSDTEIVDKVRNYIVENNIALTEEQTDSLIQLMLDISHKDYSVDDVKNAYQTSQTVVSTTKNIFEKIHIGFNKLSDFFSVMWQKLWGIYQELPESEKAKIPLGILNKTNDEVFGDDVIITNTDYYEDEATEEVEETHEETVVTEEENSTSIIEDVLENPDILCDTETTDNTSEEILEEIETVEQNTELENIITEENEEVTELKLEDCECLLDYVIYYYEHEDEINKQSEENKITTENTFESLTK